MPHLQNLVFFGKLVLSCPFCKSKDWKHSLDKGALVCKKCSTESTDISWVEKIREVGDEDPYITLLLVAEKNGISVTVDTTYRNSKDGESIHFNNILGGVHSVATLRVLTEILSSFQKRDGTDTVFIKGVGGILHISQKDGENDVFLKTENFYGGKPHGAEVFFPRSHDFFHIFRS